MFNLRDLRKSAGLTMKELGAEIGVAESTISQYETGKRQPDYETLLKLGEFFGVSIDYLLRGDTQQEKPLVNQDQELTEYLEELKNREDMRMLFSLAKGATKEDVMRAAKIIEALKGE